MKITITATTTEEESYLLAKQKWRSETIMVMTWDPSSSQEVPNPQSPADFIRQVYESMIVADVVKVFTEYRSQELKQQQIALEEAVRESVQSSITSIVE